MQRFGQGGGKYGQWGKSQWVHPLEQQGVAGHHDHHPPPHDDHDHCHHYDRPHHRHHDQPQLWQALHSNPTPGGLGLAGAPPIHFTQVKIHHNDDDNDDDDDSADDEENFDVDDDGGDNEEDDHDNIGDNKHDHCHLHFREAWLSSKQEMVTIGDKT